jgi:hypothetical protein
MKRRFVRRECRCGHAESTHPFGPCRYCACQAFSLVPGPLCCMDCDEPYADFPLDTTIPDEQWALIHGSPGGVLCASCIVKRAAKLKGVVAVRAYFEFADAPSTGTPATDESK